MPTRVLLVDPDEDIVNVIAKFLARRGFEPLAATTERECVRHLRESAPHVLVIEPHTEGAWGYKLLTHEDKTLPVIPIVVVSRRSRDDAKLSSDSAVQHWLIKPVNTSHLATILNQTLQNFT